MLTHCFVLLKLAWSSHSIYQLPNMDCLACQICVVSFACLKKLLNLFLSLSVYLMPFIDTFINLLDYKT